MKNLICIFLLIAPVSLNAQSDENMLHSLVFDIFGNDVDTILLNETVAPQSFNYTPAEFEFETGFNLPKRFFKEWNVSLTESDKSKKWDPQQLNEVQEFIVDGEIILPERPVFVCLSKDEMRNLIIANRTWEILTISRIVYDKQREDAYINTITTYSHGFTIKTSYLLKKVYGKWIIVSRAKSGKNASRTSS